jgi:MtN3 and saliva related transmembrane protein
MTILELLTTFFGVLMSLGHFPQAYIMIKNKSGANVSLITYVIFAVGTTIWFFYGITIKNIPIITGYGPGVIGSWLVVFLKKYFEKNKIR